MRTSELIDVTVLEVYPIGKAQVPSEFDADAVDAAIEALSALPPELRQVVAGCTNLDQPIREGAWSIRALVHHIADSHMNAFVRTKLALTEESPLIKTYDEVAWSQLADSAMPVESSLELVDVLHQRWVTLLRSLGRDEFERQWRAPGADARPAWRLPILYAWHGRHHVEQIRLAREHFGI